MIALKRAQLALVVACLTTATLAGCGGSSGDAAGGGASQNGGYDDSWVPTTGSMKGPQGEPATPLSEIKLTPDQEAKVKAGHFTAAIAWHELGTDLPRAENEGIKARFAELGIEIVSTTNAEFDAAKQKSDIESALSLKPNVLISLPVDAVTSASAFRDAAARGTKLVFLGNQPEGFTYDKDYIGVLASDERMQGGWAAKILADSLKGKGNVGMVYYDADFFVTNQRDDAFKQAMAEHYPGIKIVAEEGFQDPSKVSGVASAMITRNPNLDGIYTTWAEPAEGVLAALRDAGRKDIKVSTIDLSEPLALDMANGGPTVGMSANRIYDIGVAAANTAALGLIGEKGPEYGITTSIPVTPSSVLEGWQTSYGTAAPGSVQKAFED